MVKIEALAVGDKVSTCAAGPQSLLSTDQCCSLSPRLNTPLSAPQPPLGLQLPSDVKLNYFDAENNMQEVTVGSLTKGKKVRRPSLLAPVPADCPWAPERSGEEVGVQRERRLQCCMQQCVEMLILYGRGVLPPVRSRTCAPSIGSIALCSRPPALCLRCTTPAGALAAAPRRWCFLRCPAPSRPPAA